MNSPDYQKRDKIKKIDLELFYCFLTIISETQSIGITKLQRGTGTNPHVCKKYIEFFERLGIVNLEISDQNKEIKITNKGRHILSDLSSYLA